MKLQQLLLDIGLRMEQEETKWNPTRQTYEGTGHMYPRIPTCHMYPRIPTCHSKDKMIIKNHLEDEVPFYVQLGPIAIFAVRIPTGERYAYFVADSIGFANYEISRYGAYNLERFSKIKNKLTAPATFASGETEEFKLFHTLKTIAGDSI